MFWVIKGEASEVRVFLKTLPGDIICFIQVFISTSYVLGTIPRNWEWRDQRDVILSSMELGIFQMKWHFPKLYNLVFYLSFASAPSTIKLCLLQVLIEISDEYSQFKIDVSHFLLCLVLNHFPKSNWLAFEQPFIVMIKIRMFDLA